MEEKYFNITNTALQLGIKVRTVRQWIRDSKIKAVKYPNCNMWFIPESEIKRIRGEYADGNQVGEHS